MLWRVLMPGFLVAIVVVREGDVEQPAVAIPKNPIAEVIRFLVELFSMQPKPLSLL